MKKFLKNIVKLKKISTIKDFRFGTFPSISGSGSCYTFYRPPWSSQTKAPNDYNITLSVVDRGLKPLSSQTKAPNDYNITLSGRSWVKALVESNQSSQ